MSGKLKIYGAGGAGTNIASYFNSAAIEPNCAAISTCYIDTSRSNIKEGIDESNVFILDNVDGSGKVRSENHVEINNVVRKILLSFEPEDFNVVVFSASGGSGSVIGPLIVSELLSRGESVVAVVVGSHESVITANNTMNTIKSLESISKRADQPVVMYYEHNDRKRSEVDTQLKLAISALAVLASKQNRELDTKDIANWLMFNKTTSVSAQLATLEIFKESEAADDVTDPISVVSLYDDEDTMPLKAIPEYHAAGYLPVKSDQFNELHYIISIDTLPSIVGDLKATLGRYQTQKDSRVKQTSIVDPSDEVNDNGLVL